MKATELHIGQKVTYTIDGKKIPSQVLGIIDVTKCRYNNEVYIELSKKVNGCSRTWVDAASLES